MDEQACIDRIRTEFPDLAFAKTRWISHGWDNHVLALDEQWIFRFPISANDTKRFLRELDVMEYIAKHITLPIPSYTYIAADRSFAGYRMIEGNEMKPWRLRSKVSPRHKRKIARQLGQFLTEMHSMPMHTMQQRYGYTLEDTEKEWNQLHRSYEKHARQYLSKQDQRRCADTLQQLKSETWHPPCMRFLHGDVYFSHILINATHSSIAGMIDFTDMCIADPACDFAELWFYGPAFVHAVYDVYDGPKDDAFLDRSKLYWKRIGIHVLTKAYQSNEEVISLKIARWLFETSMRV